MALSNTATPKYYAAFRESVLRGEIRVNREISMEMNRIDRLIRNPAYYYDDKVVDGWIAFCENELTLTDGSDLQLLDYFKVWGEELFGWYYFIEIDVFVPFPNGGGQYVRKVKKKRLINKQIIVLGRGGAKSMYDAAIQAYGLVVDTTTTEQFAVGPTMRQSDEVMAPIRTAIIRSRGPLFKFLTEGSLQNTTGSKANRQKLSPTKKGIENFLTNSILETRPLSIDKLQGFRVKYSTLDEWLSGDIREDPIGAIEQGAMKVDDYVIVCTSSEGTVRNGPGDEIKMEMMSILKGEYDNPHCSIWWYKLDDISEVGQPENWIKANPGLGKTVSYETYQLEVEKAEKVPSSRNDILAKRFGLAMEGYTYFFSYEETLPTASCGIEYTGMPCSFGLDLSQGDDFCTFLWLFPLSGSRFGIKTLNFITSSTYSKLPQVLCSLYDTFVEEGSLRIVDTPVLKIPDIYEEVSSYIDEHQYSVMATGYDPYNADGFIPRWVTENGPLGVTKVIQGYRTETVPLGQIKTLMENRLILFDQKIMKFALGNAITIEDNNGNRKLMKRRRDRKIDPVSALVDAFYAYTENEENFI